MACLRIKVETNEITTIWGIAYQTSPPSGLPHEISSAGSSFTWDSNASKVYILLRIGTKINFSPSMLQRSLSFFGTDMMLASAFLDRCIQENLILPKAIDDAVPRTDT